MQFIVQRHGQAAHSTSEYGYDSFGDLEASIDFLDTTVSGATKCSSCCRQVTRISTDKKIALAVDSTRELRIGHGQVKVDLF